MTRAQPTEQRTTANNARGAAVQFKDDSSFILIRDQAGDLAMYSHPRGKFPNEATELWHRLYKDGGATADDWHLLKRLEAALENVPGGMCITIE